MLLNVSAGTPTTREPSMSNDDMLLICCDGRHKWDRFILTGVLIENLNQINVTDRLTDLHHPRRQQSLDDGLGLTFIPARHIAESGEGIIQVQRVYRLDLTGGQAGASIAEGRNGRGIDVASEVTRQSCSNLEGKSKNFVRCSYISEFVFLSVKVCSWGNSLQSSNLNPKSIFVLLPFIPSKVQLRTQRNQIITFQHEEAHWELL